MTQQTQQTFTIVQTEQKTVQLKSNSKTSVTSKQKVTKNVTATATAVNIRFNPDKIHYRQLATKAGLIEFELASLVNVDAPGRVHLQKMLAKFGILLNSSKNATAVITKTAVFDTGITSNRAKIRPITQANNWMTTAGYTGIAILATKKTRHDKKADQMITKWSLNLCATMAPADNRKYEKQ